MPTGRISHLTNGGGVISMMPGEWRVPFLTRDCREKVAVGDVIECSYDFCQAGELAGKLIATNITKSKGS